MCIVSVEHGGEVMAEWEEEGWRRLSGVVVEEEAEGVVRITSVARGNGALATS